MKTGKLKACLAFLLILAISCQKEKPGYNIILISIDCLRADHLSCYGYRRKTSPNIDKIAEKGVIF